MHARLLLPLDLLPFAVPAAIPSISTSVSAGKRVKRAAASIPVQFTISATNKMGKAAAAAVQGAFRHSKTCAPTPSRRGGGGGGGGSGKPAVLGKQGLCKLWPCQSHLDAGMFACQALRLQVRLPLLLLRYRMRLAPTESSEAHRPDKNKSAS